MKILNIIQAQNVGGVDQVFRYYNQALINNSNKLALVISDNGKDDYQIPSLKKIYKLKGAAPIFDIIHLLFIIYSFKPQIIICHSARPMRWMGFLKFIIPAKTIGVNHSAEYKKSLHCQYVFSVNEKTRDLAIAAGKRADQSCYIPNMIDTGNKKFNQKEFSSPIKIGMFGRIEYGKGFDLLIKAGAILKEKGIDLKLIIGGFDVHQSYNQQTLIELVRENKVSEITEFVGVVKDKKKFFDNIDIFCVPSRLEAFGMVIIESFLYSTPVISSNSDGAKIIIKDGEDALIFTSGDHIALADELEFLIKNPDFAKKISANAFQKVLEKYSLEKVGKILQSELEKINSN